MKLYHLSTHNLNNKYLEPRIPSNYLTKNGYENNKTPRVCFTQNISGALMAINQRTENQELFVHEPIGDYKTKIPSIKEVPDCKITSEVWVLDKVQIKCIGKILAIKDKMEDGIPFKYGSHTAELYEWEWRWLKKLSECEKIYQSLIDICIL